MIAQRLAGENCLVLALAADHVVLDQELFLDACRDAALAAGKGRIVTFGITPTSHAAPMAISAPATPSARARFARSMPSSRSLTPPPRRVILAEGYPWNSGNFLFPAQLLIDEATRFEPEIVEAVRAASRHRGERSRLPAARSGRVLRLAGQIDRLCSDGAHRPRRRVAGTFRWSDIRSWDALRELSESDESGNVTAGRWRCSAAATPMFARKARWCCGGAGWRFRGATDDTVLVMPADQAQDVQSLVAKLKAERRNAAEQDI